MSDHDKYILIDVPMPIVTPRLVLRPLQAGDGGVLHEAKEETWDSLSRWMIWTKENRNRDVSEAYVRDRQARFILREGLTMVGLEKETDRPVIWTGYHYPDWSNRHFSIGYWVRKTAQGKGYATESTNALIRYAFNALGARRVAIGHAEGNAASQRVIEKLGFKREAVHVKAHELPDGTFVDDLRYARLDMVDLPPLDIQWGLP